MPCIATQNITAFNRLTSEIAKTKAELVDWYALSKNKSVSVFYEKDDGSIKKQEPKWKSHENECSSCRMSNTWSYSQLTIDALELTSKPIQACKDRLEKLEKEIRDLEE